MRGLQMVGSAAWVQLPAPHTADPSHLQVPKLPFSCSTLMNTLASLSRVEVPNLTCRRGAGCALL